MLMKQRNRNATSRDQGCGGRYCVCCDDSPKYNKKNRRAIRRIEKQRAMREWKKEL